LSGLTAKVVLDRHTVPRCPPLARVVADRRYEWNMELLAERARRADHACGHWSGVGRGADTRQASGVRQPIKVIWLTITDIGG
jgi:hypothetical protein